MVESTLIAVEEDPDLSSLKALFQSHKFDLSFNDDEYDQIGLLTSRLHTKNLAYEASEVFFSRSRIDEWDQLKVLDFIITNVQGTYLVIISEYLHFILG